MKNTASITKQTNKKTKWFEMSGPLANFFSNVPRKLHCKSVPWGTHTAELTHFPVPHTLTHPGCLICFFTSCLSPALFSVFLLVLCSHAPIPPLIFVFLKAIVLLDHYEILRGTDCCPPYPGENRKAERASLTAPVNLSRVASHWYYYAPQTVRPVC